MKTSKNLEYYMALNYPILLEKYEEDNEQKIGLRIPELKGVWASGDNFEQAITDLEETKKTWFEVCLKEEIEIPEPVSEEDFSGKFVLRVEPSLHRVLSEQAKQTGVSLNRYVKEILKEHLKDSEVLTQIAELREVLKPLVGLSKEMVLIQHRVKSLEDAFSSQPEQIPSGHWITREFSLTDEGAQLVDPLGTSRKYVAKAIYCASPSHFYQLKKED